MIPAARQRPEAILSLHTSGDGDLTAPRRRSVLLAESCLGGFGSSCCLFSFLYVVLCSSAGPAGSSHLSPQVKTATVGRVFTVPQPSNHVGQGATCLLRGSAELCPRGGRKSVSKACEMSGLGEP